MKKTPRIYLAGMVVAMLAGMIIAACFGPSPEPAEAEPQAVEAEAAPVEAAPVEQTGSSTLDIIKDRGKVICVGNANLPGFGYLDEEGAFSGFDVDFCKAFAAAIFGDAEAFEIRAATAKDRFTVLQSGEADVLTRNTTWTMSRDTDLGGNFGPTTFFDGQGMMVRIEDGFKTLEDLAGGSICVQSGTTTELNLADQMAARGIDYEPVVFETVDENTVAYDEGRCDAYTTDKSGLVSSQTTLSDPSAHEIMDVTLSKEPLGPMVRHGDDQWFDVVNWIVYVTFLAEEAGITSENIGDFMNSDDPNIAKLLGEEGEFGAKIGLDNDWAVNVISQVGNYAEIYDRNLGPDTVFNLPRGQNAGYWDGGLLYAPPIR